MPRSKLVAIATPVHTRPSPADIEREFAAHRRGLTGFCYRMLGSGMEAEDAVQETLVRAWKAADRFEGRSSVKSWLYKIAGNVCIDMHRSPQRRARPIDFGPSTAAPGAEPGLEYHERTWVQPMRDDRILEPTDDPAELAAARDSVRLAFVAALQHLPPKQRAVLILCSVLKWQAAEVADLLDTTTASVNSALQRARTTLAHHPVDPLDSTLDDDHTALLAKYVDAFERYDVDELVGLLHDDATLSMPPYALWLEGPDDIGHWFGNQGKGCAGSRLVAVAVNGTAGFASYRHAGPGRWEPWGIQLIEVTDGKISGHHNYLGAELFEFFDLPDHVDA